MGVKTALVFWALVLIIPQVRGQDWHHAETHFRRGDYAAAQQHFMSWLRDDGGERLSAGYTLEALNRVYRCATRLANQKQTFSFFNELLRSPRYNLTATYIFYYLAKLGDANLQEEFLLHSLKTARDDGQREDALLHLYSYFRSKNLETEQVVYLQKLIDFERRSGHDRALAYFLNEMGNYERQQGEFYGALGYYWQAVELAQKLKSRQIGYLYLRIADVYRVINKRELARYYLEKAEAPDRTPERDDADVALKELVLLAKANLCYERRDFNQARGYLEKSFRLKKRTSPREVVDGSAAFQKAELLWALKYPTQAMKLLEGTIASGIAQKRYGEIFFVLASFAEKLIETGDWARSWSILEKMDDLFAPYYRYYFAFDYLRARWHERRGNVAAASRFYAATVDRFDSFFDSKPDQRHNLYRPFIERIYDRLITFSSRRFVKTGDAESLCLALYFSEVRANHLYDLQIGRDAQSFAWQEQLDIAEKEYRDIGRQYVDQLSGGDDSPGNAALEKRFSDAKKRYLQWREIATEQGVSYRIFNRTDLKLDRLRQQLGSEQMILRYALLEEQPHLFYITRTAAGILTLPLNTPELTALVEELILPMEDFASGRVDSLRVPFSLDTAHTLYKVLLREVLEKNPGKSELFIVPDRELFQLPFEILVSGFNRSPLQADVIFSEYRAADFVVQSHAVTYWLTLIDYCRPNGGASGENGKRIFAYDISIFGNPTLAVPGGQRLPLEIDGLGGAKPLPSLAREISLVQQLYSGERVVTCAGADFQRRNVLRFGPRSRLIHIATHFISNAESPWYSALLMSVGQGESPLLYARDICRLSLAAELVMLSACESAEGKVLGVRGLSGMGAAFRNAGARSLVVSLWPVDEFHAQIVPLFYEAFRHGVAPSQALREAKLRLFDRVEKLSGGHSLSFSHPFLWANYIVYSFAK